MPLQPWFTKGKVEAGCDEAGRGCLAGPVFTAAVILPPDFFHPLLNDSKKLTAGQRDHLREVVEKEAISWSVASLEAPEIDRFNILNATFMAMHKAIRGLHSKPEALLIDGNRFLPFPGIPHTCLVKGDSRFASIAAASVLAKTHRDACMLSWHSQYPGYHWDENKGYPTTKHREAIKLNGTTPLHRQSFKLLPKPAVPALR